jgi:hypothetical protein
LLRACDEEASESGGGTGILGRRAKAAGSAFTNPRKKIKRIRKRKPRNSQRKIWTTKPKNTALSSFSRCLLLQLLCKRQIVSCVEVDEVLQTANYVNYDFSGERWLAGSGCLQISVGVVNVNTTQYEPIWGHFDGVGQAQMGGVNGTMMRGVMEFCKAMVRVACQWLWSAFV